MRHLIRFAFSVVMALTAIGSVHASGLSYMTVGPANRADRYMSVQEGQIGGKAGMPMHEICITSSIQIQIQVKRVGLSAWESVKTSEYKSGIREYMVCSRKEGISDRAMEAIAINPVRNNVYTAVYQVYSKSKWWPMVKNGGIAGLPGSGYPIQMIAIGSYEG